ncbi:MAG: NAD-dependent epimerase/dehydratase family protein [Vampirovibrionales bacterium]|nr:NAD-dependent epimerase/dehydratase family protein [Vampirovibrionales bacterium]
MAKRVLVTGGAGLIGSHLTDLLLREGHSVRILDNLEPQTHLTQAYPAGKPEWVSQEAEFLHGDMRSEADLKKTLKNIDWVFHQAAFGGFTTALTQYMDVNATGTARLFEIIRQEKLPVEKIVAASSQAIYGEGLYHCKTHGDIVPEMRSREQLLKRQWESRCPECLKSGIDSELRPVLTPENSAMNGETIYAVSKLAEEKLTLGLGKLLGIPTVALRYAVTYGPRQSIFNPYTGVVSIFSTRLLNDKAPVIYEDGKQTRDFLFVEDNARANLFVMEHADTAYQVYNVGTGQPLQILDLVSTLAKIYDKPVSAELPGSFRPGDVRHFVHNPKKLQSLGWKPTVSLQQGISQYVDWIATQQNIKDYFEQAQEKLQQLQVVVPAVKAVSGSSV